MPRTISSAVSVNRLSRASVVITMSNILVCSLFRLEGREPPGP
jgi:hypothetical protein